MRDDSSGKSGCREVKPLLALAPDGELSPAEARTLGIHLDGCGACRQEAFLLTELSEWIRQQAGSGPAAPDWESLERRIAFEERVRVPASTHPGPRMGGVGWIARYLVPAAALLLLTVSVLLLLQGRKSAGSGEVHLAMPFGAAFGRFLETPGSEDPQALDRFLAGQKAREIPVEELSRKVKFRLFAPERLPGGFRLKKCFLFPEQAEYSLCLRYQKGEEWLAIFQQSPNRPSPFKATSSRENVLGRVPCWRKEVGRSEILQVEPDGSNLAFVARKKSVELEDVVTLIERRGFCMKCRIGAFGQTK